jgi:hypothetical protein
MVYLQPATRPAPRHSAHLAASWWCLCLLAAQNGLVVTTGTPGARHPPRPARRPRTDSLSPLEPLVLATPLASPPAALGHLAASWWSLWLLAGARPRNLNMFGQRVPTSLSRLKALCAVTSPLSGTHPPYDDPCPSRRHRRPGGPLYDDPCPQPPPPLHCPAARRTNSRGRLCTVQPPRRTNSRGRLCTVQSLRCTTIPAPPSLPALSSRSAVRRSLHCPVAPLYDDPRPSHCTVQAVPRTTIPAPATALSRRSPVRRSLPQPPSPRRSTGPFRKLSFCRCEGGNAAQFSAALHWTVS